MEQHEPLVSVRTHRWASVLLALAMVAAATAVIVLTGSDGPTLRSAPTAPLVEDAPTSAPPTEPPPTAVTAPSSTLPASQAAAAAQPEPSADSTDEPAPASDSPGSSSRSGEVACQSDLSVGDAPDAAYSFECTRGGTPIAWPTDRLRIAAQGLNALQSAGLAVAIVEFQTVAHFDVTFVDAPADADVVITQAGLPNDENGYTTVHYTCDPDCAYDHADVQLSTSAPLLESLWVSTILHELGHVAGLSHVGRASQLMYPLISATSLPVYSPGDAQGLRELAQVRDAAAS